MKKPLLLHAKLALAHLAYLRALAQGVPGIEAARRYLGLAHGHEFAPLHRWVIDLARAVARRAGLSAWRLLGVEIAQVDTRSALPSLDEWAHSQQLEGWSESEIQSMYEDAFADEPMDAAWLHKAARAQRLMARRLALIDQLEKTAAFAPSPGDPLTAWFAGVLAEHLVKAGITTLDSLLEKIKTGGRWWTAIDAIGQKKAARITAAARSLLPPSSANVPQFQPSSFALAVGGNRSPARLGGLNAATDQEAIEIWVMARARSPATEIVYRREAIRFALFCAVERGLPLSSAGVQDCQAYLAFLEDIPARWISRRRSKPFAPGWAPFRGQLSRSAKALSVSAIQALFVWLLNAGYLASNPWTLVSRRQTDAPIILPASRSIPRDAWTAIVTHLTARAHEASAARLLFVLRFTLATGLRPAELLAAQLGHLSDAGECGMVLTVIGKGGKARLVPVPVSALAALDIYLATRAMKRVQDGLKAFPLVASTLDARVPVSYRVFLRSFQSLVRCAMAASELPLNTQERVLRATLHWLRHTHAVRFVEAGGAIDILQENMGHTDSKTTAGYYQGELSRRAEAMRVVFSET